MICWRVSSSVAMRRRSTTLAGISSSTSTVSSRYISSMTSSSSESVRPPISISRMSLSISVKVSAASSFARRRNTMTSCFWEKSSISSARSTGYMFSSSSLSSLYFLSSSIWRIRSSVSFSFSSVSYASSSFLSRFSICILLPPVVHVRENPGSSRSCRKCPHIV